MSDNRVQNRVIYLDALKVIAIFGVLVIHCTSTAFLTYEPLSLQYFFTIIPSCLSRISVPIFVMCSGVVFLNTEKNISARSIWLKYIARILLVLMLFSVFYEIVTILEFYSYTGVFDLSVIKTSINNLAAFNTYFHLYYLYIIVLLYALVPVLRAFVSHSDRKSDFYFLCFLFVTANFLPTLRMYYPFNKFFGGMTLHYSLNFAYGMLSYYFLGYYLNKYELSRVCKRLVLLAGTAGFVVIFSGTLLDTLKTGLLNEDYINTTNMYIYFMAASVFIIVKDRSGSATCNRFKKCIITVSQSTFTIYLVHQFYNIVLARLGLSITTFSPFVSFPLIVVLDFVLSYFTYLVFKKIPLLKKLV